MANILSGHDGSDKLHLTSGEFSTTIKDSQASPPAVSGVDYDGTNTQATQDAVLRKHILYSGLMTTTVKASIANTYDNQPRGISSDDDGHVIHAGIAADKLYWASGKYTNTLKDSEDVSAVDTVPEGVSWDGTNTPWVGSQGAKMYLQSGKFASVIKDSALVPAGGGKISFDIGWNGTDTLLTGPAAGGTTWFWKISGQFTTTVKTSLEMSAALGAVSRGIETDDYDARVGAAAGGGGVVVQRCIRAGH